MALPAACASAQLLTAGWEQHLGVQLADELLLVN